MFSRMSDLIDRVPSGKRSATRDRPDRDWLHRFPLVILSAAACVGILLDQLGTPTAAAWWTSLGLLGLATAAFALGPQAVGSPPHHRSAPPTIAVILLIIPCYGLRHRSVARSYQAAPIRQLAGETVQPAIVRAVIDRPPVLRRHPLSTQRRLRGQSELQTQFEARTTAFRSGVAFVPTGGRVLVTVDEPLTDLSVGDTVTLFGDLSGFRRPSNPGEPDLRDVYRQRGVHARFLIDNAGGVVVASASTSWFDLPMRAVAAVASSGRESLLRHTDDSSGPLAMALVLGQREFVERPTRDLLLVTGTAHLLSVSGLHLAIVVVMAQWLATLAGLSVRWRVVLILATCLFYTAVTGGRPPVVRAAILVAAFALSLTLHRPAVSLNSLGLAALILLFWNPLLLRSVGVQLSFLAVATLVLCGRRRVTDSISIQDEIAREDQLDKLIDKSRSVWWFHGRRFLISLRAAFLFSSSVTLVAAPLVWYQFNVISPISALTNVTLGPPMFVALAAGLLTIGLDAVSPVLAMPAGWLCHVSLSLMRGIIEFAAGVPGGHVWLPRPPLAMVIAFYVLLLAWLIVAAWTRNEDAGKGFWTSGFWTSRRRLLAGATAWLTWIALAIVTA